MIDDKIQDPNLLRRTTLWATKVDEFPAALVDGLVDGTAEQDWMYLRGVYQAQ